MALALVFGVVGRRMVVRLGDCYVWGYCVDGTLVHLVLLDGLHLDI